MNLMEYLKAKAKKSMEEFIEDEWGLPPDPCDYLRDKYWDWENEFADGAWWDFPESDLTIQNINELLVVNAKFTKAHSYNPCYSTDPPLDVDTLLRRYARWMVSSNTLANVVNHTDHFQRTWEDVWEEKFPE